MEERHKDKKPKELERSIGGYEDEGLIPIPSVRATELDSRPRLYHSTTPFASNGPVQETQPNPQREPDDGRNNT
jgi:hypothetical protein